MKTPFVFSWIEGLKKAMDSIGRSSFSVWGFVLLMPLEETTFLMGRTAKGG